MDPRIWEDAVTKHYMLKHTRRRVRGGTHCNEKINEWVARTIDRELAHAREECFSCGKPWKHGHNCAVL